MAIEILGYDVFNGGKTSKKVFKPNFVKTISEVDTFERKVKKRYEKKHPHEEIEVYTIFRVPKNEYVPYPKTKKK